MNGPAGSRDGICDVCEQAPATSEASGVQVCGDCAATDPRRETHWSDEEAGEVRETVCPAGPVHHLGIAQRWGEVTCAACRAEIRYAADGVNLREVERAWALLDSGELLGAPERGLAKKARRPREGLHAPEQPEAGPFVVVLCAYPSGEEILRLRDGLDVETAAALASESGDWIAVAQGVRR